ncbi:MAG: cytochrome c [Armatimonadetes bacterium]|nr:cytochrome c [Armatimonadota bacterium]
MHKGIIAPGRRALKAGGVGLSANFQGVIAWRDITVLILAAALLSTGCGRAAPVPVETPLATASAAPEVATASAAAEVATASTAPEVATASDPGSGPPVPSPSVDEAVQRSLPGHADTRMLRNPSSGSYTSVQQGKMLYAGNCAACHGADGRGDAKAMSQMRLRIRTLTNPAEYKYGASDRDIYRAIAYGVPGSRMGTWKKALKEEQLWDIVNYVVSLQQQ